ncbi:hypothetical protein K443DRAFT_685816, partial [Laccaria amethystina LaAM-08-1]
MRIQWGIHRGVLNPSKTLELFHSASYALPHCIPPPRILLFSEPTTERSDGRDISIVKRIVER